MPKYEFESTRWLRSQAKAHHARKDFDTASTFRTVAEEIDGLRNHIAKLEAEAVVLREKTEMAKKGAEYMHGEMQDLRNTVGKTDLQLVVMQDEISRLKNENLALREAARALLSGKDYGVIHAPCGHFYYGDGVDCDCGQRGAFFHAAVVFGRDTDRLAALVGEG